MPMLDLQTHFASIASGFTAPGLLYVLVVFVGLNLSVWASIACIRFLAQLLYRIPYVRTVVASLFPKRTGEHISPEQVAIIMPAYNEELVIAKSIQSLLKIVPAHNIYIISDGSTDNTATIARSLNVHVLEPQNQGKAGALKTGIEHFRLAERYVGVLFVDADTIISPEYLTYALPYLEDPRVAAVAGFAKTLWEPRTTGFWNLFFLAYRDRGYTLFQYILKYAQAWLPVSTTHIIPGFCSLYRASILPRIDIAAKGLVIEDFNMTFEVHAKKLGKIILDPRVYGNTQDPDNLNDYYKQVRRWHLGLWQTLRRHGFWPSLFSFVFLVYLSEVVLASLGLFVLPFLLLFMAIVALLGNPYVPLWAAQLQQALASLQILQTVGLLFIVDYTLSILVGLFLRRPQYIWYGLGFWFLRFLDVWVFLATFPRAFFEHSTGVWVSPTRRSITTAVQ